MEYTMKREVLQKFFMNRGIDIPNLNPEKWVENLDGSPSANFYLDFSTGEITYISGSGKNSVKLATDKNRGRH